MKRKPHEIKNVAASVRARLLLRSREIDQEYQLLLTRYGIERLLYRLSVSPYRERFVLKGAQLFNVWHHVAHRATRDLDLLGFGNCAVDDLVIAFREICTVKVGDDGIIFDPTTVLGKPIRAEDLYVGVRLVFIGKIENSRIHMQVDVGFGDNLAIEPVEISFPSLLDMPLPKLRGYRMETSISEKYQALVSLGILNSRMKDYFDFWFLGHQFHFDGQELSSSIKATCTRRGRTFSGEIPIGLTEAFWQDSSRQATWLSFWNKSVHTEPMVSLQQVVSFSAEFLLPPTIAAANGEPFPKSWQPGGPWKHAET
jgi:hypothetical protein